MPNLKASVGNNRVLTADSCRSRATPRESRPGSHDSKSAATAFDCGEGPGERIGEDEQGLPGAANPCLEHECLKLVPQMNEWIAACRNEIGCEPNPTIGELCLRRVWSCWSYHWQEALKGSRPETPNSKHVAAVMRGRQPAAGRDKAGADLVFDIVLVESVLAGENNAIRAFEREFDIMAAKLASRFSARLRNDLEWWQDTKSRLFGTPLKTGQLNSFVGVGSLSRFMETAIKRELCRVHRRQRRERDDLQMLAALPRSESVAAATIEETNEAHKLFARAWREALLACSPDDQAAARLVLSNGMSLTEAAQVLGKHKGNISKAMKRVYSRFRETIYDGNGDYRAKYRDCGEHLFSDARCSQGLLQEFFKEIG